VIKLPIVEEKNKTMYSIENNFLKIAITQKGAELTSLFNKETNTEMLWQGDPEIWARTKRWLSYS